MTSAGEIIGDGYEDHLQCPVCLDIPDGAIFLCRNGHMICEKCSTGMKMCPQCRASLEDTKIRNRTLEVLLDALTYECPHKELGCSEKIGRREMHAHAKTCMFKTGKLVKLCHIIGYSDCEFTSNLVNLKDAIAHYLGTHLFAYRKGNNFPLCLENFQGVALQRNGNVMFRPLLVEVDFPNEGGNNSSSPQDVKNPSAQFVVLSMVHGKDNNVSWNCISLSPLLLQYRVQFSLTSLTSKVPDLFWLTSVIHSDHAHAVLANPPFRIPLNVLQEHYVNQSDKSLLINLKIVPGDGKDHKEWLDKRSDEPSQICVDYKMADGNEANTPSTSGSTEAAPPVPEVIFCGIACQDCGMNPVTGVRYQIPRSENESQDHNFCSGCALSDRNNFPWFIVIRKADMDDWIDDLWKNNLQAWKATGVPIIDDRRVKCSRTGCMTRAMYTCLMCHEDPHCHLCQYCFDEESRTSDHVFAMRKRWSNV